MMSLVAPIVAAALMAQAPANREFSGEVVDGQGKAVAGAQVVFRVRPEAKSDPVEVRTTSDDHGAFRLNIPLPGRSLARELNFLAYRPGLAIGAVGLVQTPHRIVLHEPKPRTVQIVGDDARPVAGARIAIRMVYLFGGTLAEVPDSLAASLAASTGPDGNATITYLAARDQLVAVRVTATSIGSQDFLLVEQPGRSSEPAVVTIRLKSTGRIAGRILDQDGKGVANHEIEVWSKAGIEGVLPSQVGFTGGPLRTSADGSFLTPDNLMVGSTYRLVVREPGKDPITSDWITIRDKTRTLPALVLGALRTIRGRVVDRQGKPVACASVFQTGDGPARTSTEADSDGRFSLGGYRQGPAFVFVRAPGFRFHGQLIKPDEADARLELTRSSERPAREMSMLPDPIPLDESRAMARRLLEPCWKAVAEKGDDDARYRVLLALVPADPSGALQKLETVKFNDERIRFMVLRQVVLALAEFDQEEAAAVAESIADPATRAWAFLRLADKVLSGQRQHQGTLLDRSLQQARIMSDPSERLLGLAEVAERWLERGEIDKAKGLFAEGLSIANPLNEKQNSNRGLFAARLARVDLPAALAIARDFAGDRLESQVLGNIAFHIAAENPAEAERVWEQTSRMSRRQIDAEICWKLSGIDPAGARRTLEAMPWIDQRPDLFVSLALGSKARDLSASREAFKTALQGLDRIMKERPERYQMFVGTLLPAVERIDPALVPEMLWRDVASRPPIMDPRAGPGPTRLIAQLAWYDREVAAVLFEPTRALIERTDNSELAAWRYEFLAWSLFDPRAAVARLEQTPISPDVGLIWRSARVYVAESLGRSHDERWGAIWRQRDIMYGGTKRDL
jgi:hypothetical protein